jgi:hypothetical protein
VLTPGTGGLRVKLLGALVPAELAAEAAAERSWQRSAARVGTGWQAFLMSWASLHPLAVSLRREALTLLQPLAEIQARTEKP